MKYRIVTRNIELTEGLESAVISKLKKLDKFFNDKIEATITLSVENHQRHIIEITIPFNGHVLRAEVASYNMYDIIDDAVDIIEKQTRRFKSKLRARNRQMEVPFFAPEFDIEQEDTNDDQDLKIAKKKKFAIKPMYAEEAILQMELVGHNFFVYLDAESEEVNVVYKRKEGTYGLIEPSFDEV